MTEKNKPSVRITDQYRDRNAMAYELSCEGTRIIVRFEESQTPGAPKYAASARTGDKNDEGVVEATAETRAEALDKIAQEWERTQRSRPIPAFDWKLVATALSAVKAL